MRFAPETHVSRNLNKAEQTAKQLSQAGADKRPSEDKGAAMSIMLGYGRHDEPRPEVRCQEAAQLLVYHYELLGMHSPPWAILAANTLYSPDERATPHLRNLIQSLPYRDKLLYGDVRDPMRRKLADWWEKCAISDKELHSQEEAVEAKRVHEEQGAPPPQTQI